jgi:hypothetical protein
MSRILQAVIIITTYELRAWRQSLIAILRDSVVIKITTNYTDPVIVLPSTLAFS